MPEGYPSVLVHDALAKADGLTGSVPVPAEGSVLPDSYAFQRGRHPRVGRRPHADGDEDVSGPGLGEAEARHCGDDARTGDHPRLDRREENGKPSERRMVAAVYGNRLKRGMPLQADPTVIYPITKGRPLGRRILRSELQAKNGYNTYAEVGLPAGPIANPGRASIDAVLDPAQSNALYFVADGTGGHVFADTLAQHNAMCRNGTRSAASAARCDQAGVSSCGAVASCAASHHVPPSRPGRSPPQSYRGSVPPVI